MLHLLNVLFSFFILILNTHSAPIDLPQCNVTHLACIPVITELEKAHKSPEAAKNLASLCEKVSNCLSPLKCKEAQESVDHFSKTCDLIHHLNIDTQPCLIEFFKQTYSAQNWRDETTSCFRNYSFLDSNLTKRHNGYIKGESCFLNYVKENCKESNFEYFSKIYKKFADTMSIQPENSTCLDPHFQLNGLHCKGMANGLNERVGFIYQEIVKSNDTLFLYVTRLCREVQNCMQESCTYGDTETGKIRKQCGLLELAGSNFGRCISKMRIKKPDVSMFECTKEFDFFSPKPFVACQKFRTNRKCTKKVMRSVCGKEAVEDFKTSADTLADYFNCRMCSSKVALALVASLAFASAAPGLLGGLDLGDTIGEGQGGLGGVIGQQGGLGGILGGNNGNGGVVGGVTGGQGEVGGITGVDGDLLGGLIGGILGNGGLGNLLDLLDNPALSSLLQPLLEQILRLVEDLLQDIQTVLASLSTTLEGIINIITNGGPIEQQTQALTQLRNENPVSFDTIFYIVSQLDKNNQDGSEGVVPTLPVSLPTPATPQL
ncbi:unnamed protein product [Caenorhabditis brenneri]